MMPISSQATFTAVATHPDASILYNPGTSGAALKGIRAYNGKLYMGYSENDAIVIKSGCPPQDWYATFNPDDDPDDGFCRMKLRYYDPATGAVSSPQATFKSQGMNTLEVANGNLYALATDPDGPDDYIKCTTSSCTTGNAPGAIHVYSITNIGSTLYMAGSAGSDATIWKSINGGNSWSFFFQRGPTPADPNDFARYYNIGAYTGKIHVHATDFNSSDPTFSDIFTGSVRNSGPSLFPGHFSGRSNKEFAGKLLGIKLSKLFEYNGTSASNFYTPPIYDYAISNGQVFVLNTSAFGAHVYRSKDLNTWHWVDKAPDTARSLELLGGKLYVGTNDSRLYVSDKDPYTSFSVVPPIYLLLLN
jgi:hypothetical protein